MQFDCMLEIFYFVLDVNVAPPKDYESFVEANFAFLQIGRTALGSQSPMLIVTVVPSYHRGLQAEGRNVRAVEGHNRDGSPPS